MSEWNSDTIARLRLFWNEGLPASAIGRRLNFSKNAVVGKAHRLGLPARPSPIRQAGSGGAQSTAPRARRVVGPTLPPLAAVSAAPQVLQLPETRYAVGGREIPLNRCADRRAPIRGATLAPIAPPVAPQPPKVVLARRGNCCWPLGEPRTPDFRFCGDAADPGQVYCPVHRAISNVRVRDRREVAV